MKAPARIQLLPVVGWAMVFTLLAPAAGFAFGKGDPWQRFFPPLAGWKMDKAPARVQAGGLPGAVGPDAGLCLQYGFVELYSGRYAKGDGKELAVDIYKMADSLQAFGLYSRERPVNGVFLELGAEGYVADGKVVFFAGPYCVKTLAGEDGDIEKAEELARAVGQTLPADGRFPEELRLFPARNRLSGSEAYVARDFLGHSVLRNVFSAEYETAGGSFTLFFLRCPSPREAAEILEEWGAATRSALSINGEIGGGSLEDPSVGRVRVACGDGWVWGMFGSASAEALRKFDELGRTLRDDGDRKQPGRGNAHGE